MHVTQHQIYNSNLLFLSNSITNCQQQAFAAWQIDSCSKIIYTSFRLYFFFPPAQFWTVLFSVFQQPRFCNFHYCWALACLRSKYLNVLAGSVQPNRAANVGRYTPPTKVSGYQLPWQTHTLYYSSGWHPFDKCGIGTHEVPYSFVLVRSKTLHHDETLIFMGFYSFVLIDSKKWMK